jgi:hypothetical protein
MRINVVEASNDCKIKRSLSTPYSVPVFYRNSIEMFKVYELNHCACSFRANKLKKSELLQDIFSSNSKYCTAINTSVLNDSRLNIFFYLSLYSYVSKLPLIRDNLRASLILSKNKGGRLLRLRSVETVMK